MAKKADSSTALSREDVMLIARAVSDPRRFEILELIAGARNFIRCSDLLKSVDITAATMSHHLKELESAGLIKIARDGKYMRMKLCRSAWKAYLSELRKICPTR